MNRNVFRVTLASAFSLLVMQTSASFAYQMDKTHHVINLSPASSAAATTTDVSNAVNYLVSRPDKSTTWTVNMAPGKYYLTRQISANGLQNVKFNSDMNKPAQFIKVSNWNSASSGEYLFRFLMGKNITIVGTQFYGLTNFAKDANPVWPDQGVDFGSCNGVTVQNNGFFNFGNSALRVTTTERDPKPGVNSFNTKVMNNLFNNIYQLSTTPNDSIHGGTANYYFMNNVIYNLRGSIKFASRTAGAQNLTIVGNKIKGGNHFGFELNNYNNVEIRANTIQDIDSVAINIYNNVRATQQFPWGNNFSIISNNISNVGRGIRFSTEPYANGYTYVPNTVSISYNVINGVKEMTSWPTVFQTNGKVNGLTIMGNKLSNIANKKYFGYASNSTNVRYSNNLVNGSAYGPQTSTASN